MRFTGHLLFCLTLVTLVATGCSRKSDDERIVEDINTTSVHLTVGLKYLFANPNLDPNITASQQSLRALMQKNQLDITDMATIAKIGYEAKGYGASEVALGRASKFAFIPTLLQSQEAKMTAQQDHAITLAAMYLLQFNPTAPLLISDRSMLYEAWMAETAEFHNEHLDSLLRAAQAKTFAANEYCDFAAQNVLWLKKHPLKPVDKAMLTQTLEGISGLERAAAHAPQAAPILAALLLAPAIIELTPGVARIFAHLESAACLNKIGKADDALAQQADALTVLTQMGFPEADIALLSAGIAYKRRDFTLCASELKKTHNSSVLDARSKADLMALAANIENPNPDLIQRYFTDASVGLFIGKLVNQRLLERGAYTEIATALNVQQGLALYQEMNKLDPAAAIKKASKLLQ